MPDWLQLVIFVVIWFALVRWVLPRFGVPS